MYVTEQDMYEAAAAAMQEGQFQEAQDIYLRIATTWPNQLVALKNMALMALLLDDPHGAVEASHLALYLKEDDPEVLHYLATAYITLNATDKAIKIIHQILAAGYDREEFRFNLGHAYYLNQDWQKAIYHLEKADGSPDLQDATRDLLTRAKLNRLYIA